MAMQRKIAIGDRGARGAYLRRETLLRVPNARDSMTRGAHHIGNTVFRVPNLKEQIYLGIIAPATVTPMVDRPRLLRASDSIGLSGQPGVTPSPLQLLVRGVHNEECVKLRSFLGFLSKVTRPAMLDLWVNFAEL
jgi:hypothetical protein